MQRVAPVTKNAKNKKNIKPKNKNEKNIIKRAVQHAKEQ